MPDTALWPRTGAQPIPVEREFPAWLETSVPSSQFTAAGGGTVDPTAGPDDWWVRSVVVDGFAVPLRGAAIPDLALISPRR